MIDSKVREDFYGLDEGKIFFNNASYGPLLKVVKANYSRVIVRELSDRGFKPFPELFSHGDTTGRLGALGEGVE